MNSSNSNAATGSQLPTELRTELRQLRRQLSPSQQHQAARSLYKNVICRNDFLKAKRVAFYLANDGEIDPLPILFKALSMGKQCYLPIMSKLKQDTVCFAAYTLDTTVQANKWGIFEPRTAAKDFVATSSLHLVFVPIVGFDARGARLGMGKGCYDRGFAFKRRHGRGQPKLLGIAHDCQRLPAVAVNPWDVKLDTVITDKSVYTRQ
ncbi:MAG: 5-formyltetrahydrofolate cyclo-ligase [SAR86 cluster bacterium]|uniref:5-formyltetrahydrofolate cyclo-ligase n=1 Tax=SAR86 cluster bacterium TaxID=2030880 RepID=A0A2A4MS79_9GAMM|nr:MAG: 5-formyltetrahydrofolate cyclo-ligase [SAR86 cluster bacterium]